MSRLFWGSMESLLMMGESLLTESDLRYLEGVVSSKRRAEGVAWRVLLRSSLRSMGCDEESILPICYAESGAPYLSGSELFISVSHCSTMVAVVVSDEACGVDVERCDRDFERVARRFATDRDVSCFGDRDRCETLALIWSVKESLYKVAGVEGVDFIRDMEIVSVDGEYVEGRVMGCVYGLNFRFEEGCCIVHTTATKTANDERNASFA